jgi:uncharacterized membrane-anchored protein
MKVNSGAASSMNRLHLLTRQGQYVALTYEYSNAKTHSALRGYPSRLGSGVLSKTKNFKLCPTKKGP